MPIITTMQTDDAIDNILVAQKDMILDRINSGALNEAQAMLNVVRRLWTECNPPYMYKWYELQKRFAEKLSEIP